MSPSSCCGPVPAEPYDWPFDGSFGPADTAVLSIDWQHDFCSPGGMLDRAGLDVGLMRPALLRTAQVLARLRSAGFLVVHTREGHDPTLSDLPPAKAWRMARLGAGIGEPGPGGRVLVRGEPGWQIVEEVRPEPGDWVVDKPGKGAFYATDLDLRLRSRGIGHLVLTGVTTDVCVTSTLREAIDRGYECLVLEDCTAAPRPGRHEAAVDMLRSGPFGAVTTAALLLAAVG
ncbi:MULTISPECIES: cysteine hydrolase family protein [unclassified Blastococcus]